ncbi:MAG: hypothetical protein V3T39_01515 [Gammaproteobacteria bacterium]
MTQKNDYDKRIITLPLYMAGDGETEQLALREVEVQSEENDRDAAIIAAMICAARDWH